MKSRWSVVYDDLRASITSGELRPGDQIPSEPMLMDRYGWSRPTIQTAMRRLEAEGLITPGNGPLGRTVKERAPLGFNLTKFEFGAYSDDPARRIDQWESDVLAEGWIPHQIIADVGEYPAPADVAAYLDVEPGTILLRRRRIRRVSKPDQKIEYVAAVADNWTPVDIANLTIDGIAPLRSTSNTVVPGGFYAALGLRQVQFQDEIQVRTATPEESRLLEQSAGVPVGQHSRVGIDATGRRVRVLISIFSGDRQRLRYNLDVPKGDT